jgi:hypothetical protein
MDDADWVLRLGSVLSAARTLLKVEVLCDSCLLMLVSVSVSSTPPNVCFRPISRAVIYQFPVECGKQKTIKPKQ